MRRRQFITLLGGTAIAWPFHAAAQQPGKVYRIGILNAGSGVSPELRSALPEALRELGWVEGKNVVFERRYAENRLGWSALTSTSLRQQGRWRPLLPRGPPQRFPSS